MLRSSSVSSSLQRSPSVSMMRCCCCRWWWWVMVALTLALLHHQQVYGLNDGGARHEARVDSSQCSYTLVVNELDSSRCPVMQADALPVQGQDHPNHPWRDSPSSSSNHQHRYPPSSFAPKSQMRFFRQPSRVGEGGGGRRSALQSGDDQEVGVLRGQVKELEERLLDEMVRTRELNNTLSRHAGLLQRAEERLGMYGANFTAMYRAMVFVQRQLHKQRKINRSLNKKLSNVLLDVVEVNNVLTRVPTSSAAAVGVNGPSGARGGGGGKGGRQAAKLKDFQVQSVSNTRSCPGVTDQSTNFRDCAAVLEGGHRQSGVYYVKPTAAACPVPVWCDMDTPPGGWLVFQRRQDGSVSFKRNWTQYREGFGSVAAEHWLGNDNLFLLTNQAHYKLRVDLWDFSGNRVHATYSTFQVGGERDGFELTLGGHSGSAQDSLYRHNHMAFSTPDRDNDGRREAHCAAEWEAGWWFNNCWFALLNGLYHNRSDVQYRGIAWNHWKREQLRKSEMKIRPNGNDVN